MIGDGQTHGRTDEWTHGRKYECRYVWTDGWTDGRTDRRTDGCVDGCTDGRMDRRMVGHMDERMDEYMDGRMDGADLQSSPGRPSRDSLDRSSNQTSPGRQRGAPSPPRTPITTVARQPPLSRSPDVPLCMRLACLCMQRPSGQAMAFGRRQALWPSRQCVHVHACVLA